MDASSCPRTPRRSFPHTPRHYLLVLFYLLYIEARGGRKPHINPSGLGRCEKLGPTPSNTIRIGTETKTATPPGYISSYRQQYESFLTKKERGAWPNAPRNDPAWDGTADYHASSVYIWILISATI